MTLIRMNSKCQIFVINIKMQESVPTCCTGAMTHLEGTVHHSNDVVELLVVHYDAVLLDVETQLFGETLSSRFALQSTKRCR